MTEEQARALYVLFDKQVMVDEHEGRWRIVDPHSGFSTYEMRDAVRQLAEEFDLFCAN